MPAEGECPVVAGGRGLFAGTAVEAPMHQDEPDVPVEETYNPWSIVNLVFRHLVDQGLHPTLGTAGPPGEPAAALLRTLGIVPTPEGDVRVGAEVRKQLAELRATILDGT
jgi:hypothetical protein